MDAMKQNKWMGRGVLLAALALVALGAWYQLRPGDADAGLVKGNGRIEATEIDVASKLAGRIAHIEVDEGDFRRAGNGPAQHQVFVVERTVLQAGAVQATDQFACGDGYGVTLLGVERRQGVERTVSVQLACDEHGFEPFSAVPLAIKDRFRRTDGERAQAQ